MFGGDFLNCCFFAAPPAVINTQSHYKFSDKTNQLLTYAYCILRALIINLPRTASTEIKMSAKCCHQIAIEGVRSVARKVIIATALETPSKLFE
jgi:hypothetical protein